MTLFIRKVNSNSESLIKLKSCSQNLRGFALRMMLTICLFKLQFDFMENKKLYRKHKLNRLHNIKLSPYITI